MALDDNPCIPHGKAEIFIKNRNNFVHFILKSTQYKGYGIGHKKNFNKLLKKCVNARKKPKFYDAYAKFQNKTSKNISIWFFGIYHTFSIIC